MRGNKMLFWFCLAILPIASATWGQSVFSGGFPGNWGGLTGLPADPGPGSSSGNVWDDSLGWFYSGAAPTGPGLSLISYEARVTEDAADPTDGYRLRIRQEQTFTLLEPAILAIPTFFNGTITFAGPPFGPAPSNYAFGEASGHVHILDAAGTSMLSISRGVSRLRVDGPAVVNEFDFAETPAPLAPGIYRLRAVLEIAGHSGSISSLPGAESFVDFLDNTADHQRRGLATSLLAQPLGLTSSRDAVRAPEARSAFGVNGAGITIGLLELGNPYLTHAAMPRVVNATGAEPEPYGSYYHDEHALATSGIIAADTTDAAQAGIAPKASILSAGQSSFSGGFAEAFDFLLDDGRRIISRSAGIFPESTDPFPTERAILINQRINTHPLVTFVQAAGNEEPVGFPSVFHDGQAENAVTVGALNRDFTRRAGFSSFSHGRQPIKPDLVAPGEYILAPVSRDINGDTLVNDFYRGMLGDDYYRANGPSAGAISGTSFAAPMVAGTVVLMHDYQSRNTATHDDTSIDHRVMKAVLLNSARTAGLSHGDGTTPWQQLTSSGTHLVISRSLDNELGAGALDVYGALATFAAGEVRPADDNVARNFMIAAAGSPLFWDRESVFPTHGGVIGTVDYLLGDIAGLRLRATLTWDAVATLPATNRLDHLELRLYREGIDPTNLPGFDPAIPAADALIAATAHIDENVKLFDLVVAAGAGDYYLQVVNLSGYPTVYGLAVSVPEPGGIMAGAFIVACVLAQRRSRR